LVTVRGDGQQRLYTASGAGLKPVHDWVKTFEQHWNESFDRLDVYLRGLQGKPAKPLPAAKTASATKKDKKHDRRHK
jgi:hypothetical protein